WKRSRDTSLSHQIASEQHHPLSHDSLTAPSQRLQDQTDTVLQPSWRARERRTPRRDVPVRSRKVCHIREHDQQHAARVASKLKSMSERLGVGAGPDSRSLRSVLEARARTSRDEREMYSVQTPQLAKDRRQSRLDRSLLDIESSRDFLVGGALGHHTGNLALSGRQPGEAAPFRGRPGPADEQSKLGNETGQHLASSP